MPKVKLLKDVVEEGRLKVARRNNPKWTPAGKDEKGNLVESEESQFLWVPFTKGSVIEMSEASAKKYAEKGLGQVIEEEKVDESGESTESGAERDRQAAAPEADQHRGQVGGGKRPSGRR